MNEAITFRAYGLELCRMLAATALFQSTPRESEIYSRVRCTAGAGGLSMIATNLRIIAAGHVDIEHGHGGGLFSITAAQVKAILAVFDRKLPKGVGEDEYMLELEVTPTRIQINDISNLFSHDSLTLQIQDENLERGDESETDRLMRIASMLQRFVSGWGVKADLTDGRYLLPAEVARVAKAAGILGTALHVWPVDRHVLFPLGDSFVAACYLSRELEETPRPYQDAQALSEWRARLEDLVDHGVI